MKRDRNGISKALKKFFGIGDFGFSFMTNIETYYFNFFLTNIAQFALPVVTMIATVTSLVDAGLSWIYGAMINSLKPMKWGRYRSWLLVVPWLVPFLYAFQFIKLGNGPAAAVVIIAAFISSHIAWNIPFVANVAMINIASKTPKDRMELSSARALWQSLGRVFYSYIGPGAVAVMVGLVGEKNAYGATAFAFGALMAAGYFAHFKMFEGYEETGEEERLRMQRQKEMRAEGEEKKKEGSLIQSLTTNLLSNLLGVAASYLSKAVANKISARNAVISAYLSMVVILVTAFILYRNTWVVIALMSMAQFCATLTNACGPALYADCAIYSEYKTHRNATGLIMGLMNIPIKVGVVSRGLLIGACLAVAGFDAVSADPSNTTAQLERGISMGFTLIPAIAVALGAVVMIFGYKLTREKVENYSAEIEKRKQD